jgi:hypothetical protein
MSFNLFNAIKHAEFSHVPYIFADLADDMGNSNLGMKIVLLLEFSETQMDTIVERLMYDTAKKRFSLHKSLDAANAFAYTGWARSQVPKPSNERIFDSFNGIMWHLLGIMGRKKILPKALCMRIYAAVKACNNNCMDMEFALVTIEFMLNVCKFGDGTFPISMESLPRNEEDVIEAAMEGWNYDREAQYYYNMLVPRMV